MIHIVSWFNFKGVEVDQLDYVT